MRIVQRAIPQDEFLAAGELVGRASQGERSRIQRVGPVLQAIVVGRPRERRVVEAAP
jgi:hypothetical protein